MATAVPRFEERTPPDPSTEPEWPVEPRPPEAPPGPGQEPPWPEPEPVRSPPDPGTEPDWPSERA